jgi:hypothetical protein
MSFTRGDTVADIEPYWMLGPAGEVSTAHEWTWFRSSTASLALWETHLALHMQMRDLIAFAYWDRKEFERHEVLREDNPELSLAATRLGPGWQRVLTTRTQRSHPRSVRTATAPGPERPPFFTFEDLRPDGLSAWFDVRESYNRVVGPLLVNVFDPLPVETRLLQAGVAMEAFGFISAVKEGASIGAANARSVEQRTVAACDSLPIDFDLVEDVQRWSQAFSTGYNAVKHANRTLPDRAECHYLARGAEWLLRLHIMALTGLSDEHLHSFTTTNEWQTLAKNLRVTLS